ncbi:hypothetical protein AAE478_001246 [Parahypoxylon ruwenzoriense]
MGALRRHPVRQPTFGIQGLSSRTEANTHNGEEFTVSNSRHKLPLHTVGQFGHEYKIFERLDEQGRQGESVATCPGSRQIFFEVDFSIATPVQGASGTFALKSRNVALEFRAIEERRWLHTGEIIDGSAIESEAGLALRSLASKLTSRDLVGGVDVLRHGKYGTVTEKTPLMGWGKCMANHHAISPQSCSPMITCSPGTIWSSNAASWEGIFL